MLKRGQNYLSRREEDNQHNHRIILNAFCNHLSLNLFISRHIYFFPRSHLRAALNPHSNLRIFALRLKPSRFNSCLFALPRKPRLNL